MGYGDFAPPSGHHAKKPLTKKQIQKMREAYAKGDMIVEHVRQLEEQEEAKAKQKIEEELHSAFI